ncbi:MAG: hypothetical protein SYR96_28365 [Actinomycetota bacterium]|nr:hypothetical protein [Actinomycetota bacterium]
MAALAVLAVPVEAHARTDEGCAGARFTATGRYADAKLLGLRVPSVPLQGTNNRCRAGLDLAPSVSDI